MTLPTCPEKKEDGLKFIQIQLYLKHPLYTNDGGEDEYTNQVARDRENVSMK